jgi:hypothetical protein
MAPTWVTTASAAVIGADCSVTDLPEPREGHVTAVTPGPDSEVLVCGGWNSNDDFSSCLAYSPGPGWVPHSTLSIARAAASAVMLDKGVYILGGWWRNPEFGDFHYEADSSSEFLRAGSSAWEAGPALPGGLGVNGACAVAISPTQFLLIGGDRYDGSTWLGPSNSVQEYNSLTNSWATWPALSRTRDGHACGKLGGKVVVAGGYGGGAETTEVIDLETGEVRWAGDMSTPRAAFGMVKVGLPQSNILLTFGSYGYGSGTTDAAQKESLLQEWSDTEESWIPSPAVMERRASFSAVTVEAHLVCLAGT